MRRGDLDCNGREWRIPVKLVLSSGLYSICRLAPDAPLPTWMVSGSSKLFSITRTPHELSIVCAQEDAPADVQREDNWRLLIVDGPLDFSLTGVLAALLTPLAEAGVSVFALSTFDTDYLLVRAAQLDLALVALNATGHLVVAAEP
jgi:hypothetical protein